ncbi:tetratricopeptide repeat protein [Sneathiella glossodoripedis]|uniref:tetratricopeptide repeat protein n=1 Tax=Sneathiella glossodoripedis TaxID=418853 RepID=UPI00046E58EE|nr:hypothetical protein [Sneathiella glossodoripedis]
MINLRLPGQKILFLLGFILSFAFMPILVNAAEKIAIRAAEHPTYGRVVFDWGRAQSYDADIREGSLIITFKDPLEANLSVAERALQDYVGKGEIYNNNKSVRFPLKGEYGLRTAVYGTAIAVDLLKNSGATDARKSVRVRAGDHPKYSRLVVDWPTRTEYQVQKKNGFFDLVFDKSANLDIAKIQSDLPKFVSGLAVEQNSGSTTLRVTTGDNATVRAFRSGNSIAFDFRKDQTGNTTASTEVDPKPAVVAKVSKTPVQKLTNNIDKVTQPTREDDPVPSPAQELGTKDTETITASLKPAPAENVGASQAEEPADVPAMATNSPRSLIPVAGSKPMKAEPALPEKKLLVDVGNLRDGFRLIFPFEESAAMALFERSGNYWVVFDKPVALDFRNLGGPYKFLVLKKKQFGHESATIARLAVRDGYAPSVTRIQNEWRVDFRLAESPVIKNTIDIQPQPAAQNGARVFIPAVNNGDKISFIDPQAGDELVAVPLHAPSWGFGRSRTFTQFTILPSMQGIAMTARDPSVAVSVERNGVSVTAEGGLQLTRAISRQDLFADGDLTDRFDSKKDKAQLVQLDTWRQVPAKEFWERKQLLQRRVARSPQAGRNGPRMELAKFLVGHEFHADAIGVLERIRLDDPRADEDGVYRLLRGLANLGLRHLDQAEVDLFNPVFDGIAEVAPWRAKLAAEKKDWKRAASELKIGRDAFGVYDQDLSNEFNLLAAEAALEDYDIEAANAALEEIRTSVSGQVDLETAALREYLEGVSALRSGDIGRAVGKFDQTIALDHRPTTAKARFAKVNAQLALKELSPEEAIEEFRKMSFVWRGDELELNILKRIGDLQIASGQMREGLKTFKEIVMTFPKAPIARDTAREMNDIFNQLFLEGGAEALPPIKALALYYEYRELTPLGDKGDQMIRNLADRLIKVDLLEQAAQLLDHQVNFRLSGAQKAVTGAKLAVVHLWNGDPKESINILSRTRWRALPDRVKDERRYIHARANMELGKYDDALDFLESDNSETADLLRAEIYWKSKNWARATDSIDKLLQKNGAEKAVKLSEVDRQRVMQMAVAYSLSADTNGINKLRSTYRKKLVGTPDLDAFDLITDQSDASDTGFRERATAIAKIGQLESFMAGYREQLKNGEFWSTN